MWTEAPFEDCLRGDDDLPSMPPAPTLPQEAAQTSVLKKQITPRKVASHSQLYEKRTWRPKTPRQDSPKQVPGRKWVDLGNRRRGPTGPVIPATATTKKSLTETSTKERIGQRVGDHPWHRGQGLNKSSPRSEEIHTASSSDLIMSCLRKDPGMRPDAFSIYEAYGSTGTVPEST